MRKFLRASQKVRTLSGKPGAVGYVACKLEDDLRSGGQLHISLHCEIAIVLSLPADITVTLGEPM